jgi:hypothetical protein
MAALCRQSGWGNHEPSHCRRGMWLHRCGVLRINTKPELPEFIAPYRGSAVRIRTGGCGGEDFVRAELSYTLRPHAAGRSRDFDHAYACRLPARDGGRALGGRLDILLPEADAKSRSRGASCPAGCACQEDQEAARGSICVKTEESTRRIGVGGAAALGERAILQRSGSLRHELSLA